MQRDCTITAMSSLQAADSNKFLKRKLSEGDSAVSFLPSPPLSQHGDGESGFEAVSHKRAKLSDGVETEVLSDLLSPELSEEDSFTKRHSRH